MLKKENVNGANIESPDIVVDHHNNDNNNDNKYVSDDKDDDDDDDEPISHHDSRRTNHGENPNRSKQSSDVDLPFSNGTAQLNIDMMDHDLDDLDEDEADKAEKDLTEADKAKNLPKPKLIMLTLSCFFIVVATVLGTGILALPVKVSTSGFWPFFASFFFCLIAQMLIIVYMVELLQRTQAVQQRKSQVRQQQSHLAHMDQDVWNVLEDDDGVDTETPIAGDSEIQFSDSMVEIEADSHRHSVDMATNGELVLHQNTPDGLVIHTSRDDNHIVGKMMKKKSDLVLSSGPDLHAMGTFFLDWRIMRYLFELAVLVHFISIMISYSLGGTLAYAQFFNILDYHVYLIVPFVVILALVVVFLQKYIQQIISLVTLAKGGLLVLMVLLVGIIGFKIGRNSGNEWLDIGNPFLISTVALGGAINTLPVIYAKVENPSKQTIRWFRLGAISGIAVCWLLNVLWVLFILKIVPQTGPKPSLEYSNDNGEIATISLIEIIQSEFPEYNWLAIVVQIFIMVSITVSFVTMSSGLKHMLDGYVRSFSNAIATTDGIMGRLAAWFEHKSPNSFFTRATLQPLVLQFSLYTVFFASILIIALLNPKSFLSVMEVFTSMSLNMEAGLFVAIMLFRSRSMAKFRDVKIPLPLGKYLAMTVWPVAAYFLFACVYAQYIAIKNFIQPWLD